MFFQSIKQAPDKHNYHRQIESQITDISFYQNIKIHEIKFPTGELHITDKLHKKIQTATTKNKIIKNPQIKQQVFQQPGQDCLTYTKTYDIINEKHLLPHNNLYICHMSDPRKMTFIL